MDWVAQIGNYFETHDLPSLAARLYTQQVANFIQQGEFNKGLLRIEAVRETLSDYNDEIYMRQLKFYEARICFNLESMKKQKPKHKNT